MTYTEQTKKLSAKLNYLELIPILNSDDEKTRWHGVVLVQNQLNQGQCAEFLNNLTNIIKPRSQTEASIEDRVFALYETLCH